MPSPRGNLANLRPDRPGQSGNPAGSRGVLPPEIRASRKKNQVVLIQTVSNLFTRTTAEILDLKKKNSPTKLEEAIMDLIEKSKEDVSTFRYLVELMVGKIPEHDYDGFTEEDIRILNRVKEVFEEQKRIPDESSPGVGASD